MKSFHQLRCWFTSLTCAGAFAVAGAGENPGVPWPATDALGRSLPLSGEVGASKSGRFIGIFYFEWLVREMSIPKDPNGDGPLDVSKILARDPKALEKPDSPLWGRVGQYHFWGEPLFGYYRSDDRWVIRRHLQMLADAGVDVLILDATNAETYRKVYLEICAVARQIREQGGRAPQLTFMLNTRAGATAAKLYREFYEPGQFPEMWFRWEGKPLLICDPAEAGEAEKKFFTLRRAHWPFKMQNTAKAWHWEATYPQPYGFTDDPKKPEQVNVSVAQNLSAANGQVSPMSSGKARGRSFHAGKQSLAVGSELPGYNFQEQWRWALQLDPPFVMVTGWNEWIAGRWGKPGQKPEFVDQYDQEFSRDIEPMRGGHGDNYYCQLIANIRRYKGVPDLPKSSPPKALDMNASFSQWNDVAPEFFDHRGETKPRDFAGVGGMHYANHSGRNDLAVMKVARDTRNLYFYARTLEPLTSAKDTNWMWLLIDADQNPLTGWSGYDFAVNHTRDAEGRFWLEKNTGGWNWKKVAPVDIKFAGNELQLSIPRAALGLKVGSTKTAIDFKWADNLQRPGDVMDFYVSGDVAPEGRFNYRYDSE
jgi:hypothetical protein